MNTCVFHQTLAVFAVTLACEICLAQQTTLEESKHHAWLGERVKEAKSIKVGMTQADLLKVFSPDGGLQPIPPTRYRLRSCDLIRIDVSFDKKPLADREIPPERLKITKISELVLDPDFVFD
jgi:hypothetical protein